MAMNRYRTLFGRIVAIDSLQSEHASARSRHLFDWFGFVNGYVFPTCIEPSTRALHRTRKEKTRMKFHVLITEKCNLKIRSDRTTKNLTVFVHFFHATHQTSPY